MNREIQSGSIRAGLAARYDFAEHFYQHHFTVTVWIGTTAPRDCLILVWLCLTGQPFRPIIVFNPSIFWRGFPHSHRLDARVQFRIEHKLDPHAPTGRRRYVNLVLCFLGIKAGFYPIFACFRLIRRIHSQLIYRSTPCRRSTQQLKTSGVEI